MSSRLVRIALLRRFLVSPRPLVRTLLNEPPTHAKPSEVDPDRKKGAPRSGESFVAPGLQDKLLGGQPGDGGGGDTGVREGGAAIGESSGTAKTWSDPSSEYPDAPEIPQPGTGDEATFRTPHPGSRDIPHDSGTAGQVHGDKMVASRRSRFAGMSGTSSGYMADEAEIGAGSTDGSGRIESREAKGTKEAMGDPGQLGGVVEGGGSDGLGSQGGMRGKERA